MAYDLLYDVQDGVATITLHRPEVLNALTFSIYAQLRDLFVAQRLEEVAQLGVDAEGQRVEDFGTVEGDRRHAVLHVVEKVVGHWAASLFRPDRARQVAPLQIPV